MKKRLFLFFVVLNSFLTGILNPQSAYCAEQANSSLMAELQEIAVSKRCFSAVAYSQAGWDRSDYAVLASAEDFADALCSLALAREFTAPVLLTGRTELSAATAQELQRLGVKHVLIIGGPQALAAQIEKDLEQLGIESTERIFGQDRYATSLAVAQKINPANGVFLTNGTDCFELLPISGIAGYSGMPIIYLGKTGSSIDELKNYLHKNDVQTAYLVGRFGETDPEIAGFVKNLVCLKGHDNFEVNASLLNEFERILDFSRIYIVKTDEHLRNSGPVEWTIAGQAAHFGYPLVLANSAIPPVLLNCLEAKVLPISEFVPVGYPEDEAVKVISQFNRLLPSSTNYSSGTSEKKSKTPTERPKTPEPSKPKKPEHPENPAKPAPIEILEVVSPTGNGYYKAGDMLEIGITFSADVQVIGEPILKLATGTSPGAAVYTRGSGSSTLIFSYVVQPGDNSEDLTYLATNALDLNGGAILSKDADTEVKLALPVPGEAGSLSHTQDIVIDTIAPSALYISKQNVIHPNCSLTLTVEGGPLSPESWEAVLQEIKANTGTGANWLSGITADSLTLTPAADGTSALLKNTSSSKKALINADFVFPNQLIVDKAGNTADQDLTVDSYKAGSVVSVYSIDLETRQYKAGEVIWIDVEFNAQLFLRRPNRITLSLATGATGQVDRLAVCQNVDFSITNILKFKYVIQPGDLTSDLDYTDSAALQLNGAELTINGTDIAADLLLPEPGEPGSLGHAVNIAIDTFPPSAILISGQNVIPANGSVTLTVIDGPLDSMSWNRIFLRIMDNTNNGENWITGIKASDLELVKSADRITAEIRNNSSSDALINNDFLIPYKIIYDLAGNLAEADIIIDAFAD